MKQTGSSGFVDLHVHTNYSDGIFPPQEVVERAAKLALKAIAITDHDCVEGILPTIKIAELKALEVVPGLEMSAAKDENEIHILGYFIDWQQEELVNLFRRMKENRVRRMKKIIALLDKHGVKINGEKVFKAVEEGTIGRLHLARVMLEEGVVGDLNEAFDKYIGDGKPCHVKHERLDYKKAIEIIRQAGGVPVLAHPGTMGRDEDIPFYVEAGLRGIEAFHSKHRPEISKRYLAVAKKYNLIITGGSDCHGSKRVGEVLLGKVKVPYEVVEALRKEAEKIRSGK